MKEILLDIIKIGLPLSLMGIMLAQGLKLAPGPQLAFFKEHPLLMLRSFVAVLVLVPLAELAIILLLKPSPAIVIGLAILAASPAAPFQFMNIAKKGGSLVYLGTLHLSLALWPDDKWFKKENFEPEHMVESKGKGDVRNIKVLDAEVRRNIDLEFLEKAGRWMEDSKAKDQPFFIYFNHSNVHFPVLPRAEYQDSSNGGAVADCIQMVDGDFKVLLDKLDELGLRDNTIVIFAGDNGRDTSFHGPGNRSAAGPWRGGYLSTYEGNNRTAGMIRWPGKIEPRKSDEMMHISGCSRLYRDNCSSSSHPRRSRQ